MTRRQTDRIYQYAVHALLLQVFDILDFLFLRKMADQQNSLIPRRVEDAVDARQQLAHRNRIHARQDNAYELALLCLEALGKEVGLEPRFLNCLADFLLLFYTDIAVI